MAMQGLSEVPLVVPAFGAPKVSGGQLDPDRQWWHAERRVISWLVTTNLSAPINWTTNEYAAHWDGIGSFSNSFPIQRLTTSQIL